MRYIGLDLALTTDHKALVIDDRGQAITAVLRVNTSAATLEQLFRSTPEGAPEDEPLYSILTNSEQDSRSPFLLHDWCRSGADAAPKHGKCGEHRQLVPLFWNK